MKVSETLAWVYAMSTCEYLISIASKMGEKKSQFLTDATAL